jgi:hypothetical protein
MSILARLLDSRAEQEQRENTRQIARAIRNGRQPMPQSPPVYNPPSKPLMGGGVQPVWVLNMPRVR